MVKGTLFKKSIVDMKKSKTQFISIFIMATLAVSIVTGLDSIWKTIEDHSEAMYAATNLSDLWVTVPNPTEKDLWGISKINGVENEEKRFTVNADTDIKGNPTLRVYTISDQSRLDLPKLQQGNFPSQDGAVLDETFAQKHGLKINDQLSVKINEKWLRLTVKGLAYSSEQIYSAKGTTNTMPDHEKFGFIFINENLLNKVFGQKVYNQICVTLSAGTDVLQVEEQIDKVIGDDMIGIISREDSSSVNNVNAFIQQFKMLAAVFPLMFFLVTALITQSTMMRLVESQRTQIGILKALGYSKRSIIWHYTSYGLYVGLLGAVFGLFLGPNIFGRILIPWLKLTFSDYQLSVNYKNFVLSLILILLCTGGVSLYSCLKLQGDTAATLLRDKPPKEGSHIFLENLPSIWNRMKFSSKLIARNTLKNKVRLIMSVIGITGCTGLIIAAFTLCTMIGGLAEQVYGKVYTYDQKIILNSKADSRFIHNKMLDGMVQEVQETAVEIVCPDGMRVMKLLTVSSLDSPLRHLNDVKGKGVQVPDDGIAITRKLASVLHVKVGDVIELKRTDKNYVKVPIKTIVYMAAGQGMYMTDAYYKSLGETFHPTGILVKWNHQPDREFLNSDYVDEYVNRADQMADIQSNTKVVYIAAVMMIVMGAILAFVVLYNSSILNFAERIRDLATLRVLGFYQKEIRSLVLTENFLSVLLGLFCGIPVGKVLATIVATGLDDRMDLISRVTCGTVVLSGIITLLFTLMINSIVAKKMKNIDMLEALKSVE